MRGGPAGERGPQVEELRRDGEGLDRDYRVKTRAMKCKHARKWARAFLRSRKRAPRFRCLNPPDRKIPFFCSRGVKAYWVVRL